MTSLAAILIAILPWLQGGASPAGLFVVHTLVLAMAALALRKTASKGELVVASGWEGAAGAALVAAFVLSFLGVDYRFGSFLSLWDALVAAMVWIALAAAPPQRWIVLAAAAAGAAAAQAAVVLVAVPTPNMTASGSFANAVQAAAYLVIGMILSVGLALRASRRAGRAWAGAMGWGAAALIDLAALMKIGARGAIVSLVAAGVVGAITWGMPHRRARRAVLLAAAGLVTAAGVTAIAWRFDRIEDPYRFDRVLIWEAGVRAAADHPLTGMGPGMFSRRGAAYNFPLDREMFRYSKVPGSVHSAWLQALVETGVIGFVVAVLFAALLLAKAIRIGMASHPEREVRRAAALALTAILVYGLFDTLFDVPAITLTLLVLIVPLITSADPASAPFSFSFQWSARSWAARRAEWAIACAITFLYAAAVPLPYAAHVCYEIGAAVRDEGWLSAAMRLNPWNPLYPSARGYWIARQPSLDPAALAQAHLDLREASRLDPGDPDHKLELGRLHARACAEAHPCDAAAAARVESYYREALAAGHKDPRPRAELAAFLMAIGRPAAAIPILEEAVVLEPRYAGGWLLLARARLETQDQSGAREALAALDRVRADLAGYVPKNGYERDLARLDPSRLTDLERRLTAPTGG